jgi:hypothetical protein
MPDTPITANFNETLDVKVNLFSEITLYLILMVNHLSEVINLFFSEVIHLSTRIDISLS